MAHKLWTEKYRPNRIADYLFHDDIQKAAITKMIAEQSIPHLFLHGHQGTGKTTLARILIKEIEVDEMDVLEINASEENSVDIIRDKIKSFVVTSAMGPYKVVLLEEADYITPQGQAIMRNMMEQYSDCVRFILTGNYAHKIIPAIRSRCQEFYFKAPDKDDVTLFVAKILVAEKVKASVELLDKYVTHSYPDVRKIINNLQLNSPNGVLLDPQEGQQNQDYKFTLIDLIEKDKWEEARQLCCNNVSAEEWEELYSFLYTNLDKTPKFKNKQKWEEGIITIAEHLYKHTIVADREINAAAMFIKLGRI